MPWQTQATATWEDTAANNTNVNSTQRTYLWATPIFDLHPQLGGQPMSAQFSSHGVYPLPNPGQLLVQVSFRDADNAHGNAFGVSGMNITAWDEANPWNPMDLRPVTSEQDVTSTFMTATAPYGKGAAGSGVSGLLFWSPPSGAGGTVRFWQFKLLFSIWIVHPDPTVIVTAAFY